VPFGQKEKFQFILYAFKVKECCNFNAVLDDWTLSVGSSNCASDLAFVTFEM
jgi:hypothetical protein